MTKDELEQLKNDVLKRWEEPVVKRFEISPVWKSNKERMINYSLRGKNVLVIGSEAILKQGNSTETDEILKKSNGDTEQYLLELLREGENGRFYLNCHSLADAQDSPNLLQDIDTILQEKDNDWCARALDMIDPALRLLLESKCFRLIITTCFDPILEYALKMIWGEELVVKNIHNDVDMANTDIMTEMNRKSEFYDINPTLYYAFGKAVAGANDTYAITDDRKMYTIDCWLASRKPNNLLQYILNKDVMAVGCKFENWFFRFFWYLLGQKPSMSSFQSFDESSFKKGSVAIMLSDTDSDEGKTKSFIKRKRINYFEDSRAFMILLAPELIKDTPPQVGEVFISYASEDFPTANIIYEFLLNQRQKVWFDIRLRAGDRFNKEIDEGIMQSNVFMPILSNQTRKDLENQISRYYQLEWKKADEKFKGDNNDFLVFPVVIEEYSVKAGYHCVENVTDCIKDATCFSVKEHASLIDLLDEINEQRRKLKEKNSQNIKSI